MAKEECIDDSTLSPPTRISESIQLFGSSDDQRPRELALQAIRSSEYLTGLHEELLDAEKPVPMIGFRLSSKPGTKEYAHTYIAYGQTIPEKGLQPAWSDEYDGCGGYKLRPHLVLPIDGTTRGSATFWPSYNWSQIEGSRVVGWWQQWSSGNYTEYKQHQEPQITKYRKGEVKPNTKPFVVWPYDWSFSHNRPQVVTEAQEARGEAALAVGAVRNALGDLRASSEENSCRREHRIILGQKAVQVALSTLRRPAAGSELPVPLENMLDAVSAGLGI